ncbi:caspase-8 isoform X2 [Cottoperca gobio]|uniref:Caspase-8 n=1 Tax=Cottoperca gobio TaxID=56716 RepID=A0A6J2S1H6_COTGO|nr:caspase-8-like isoform X2 [Cottoperca gobio]
MDFQRLLLEVGKALGKEEVKALAFLCTDLLSRNPTSVESASGLFSRLADQDHLSAERPHLVYELLLIIQRPRLVRHLGIDYQASTTNSLISPYRKLMYNLSEGITDDDLESVKFLLKNDLPRRKLEDNVSALEVFLEMEHMDLISDTNLNLLETVIHSVSPILKDMINHFKALQVTHTSPVAEETGRQRSMSNPFGPNQVSQSLNESNASCEMPDLRSSDESATNSSNTSMDFPNVHDGEGREAPSHGLSGLSSETVSNYSLKDDDAIEMLLSPENKASSEKPFSQTTNTNIEVLETYPMTAAKRGFCLIVNNYKFNQSKQSLPTREGTNLDEDCLQKVFKWLGFEVEIEKDCDSEQMLSRLRELGSRNHSQMDCLVCCVLSHGKEGSVHGVDGDTVKIKELMEPVNGSKCASLAKKPKLFFIQACQGTSAQSAVHIEADGPERSSDCSNASKSDESIPSDADFLLGMSTVPSFVSYRDRKYGTWYIQILCQNLVQMVPRGCDLVSILTKVNADVSQKTDPTGVMKQMPQPAFTLTKKIVFPIPKAPPPSL